jgi:hypothetical protein
MIGVRLLAKQAVTRRLHDEGCERVFQTTVPGHSFWKTKWGFHFFVPEVGPDKRTPEHVLLEALADAAKSRPKGK